MNLLNKIGFVVLFSLGISVQIYALDDPKYTPNPGNGQKGTLSLERLYIDGIKTFENINIEFDFSNSTFIILGATPADNSIPTQAIETLDAGGLGVGLRGCVSKDRSITCHLSLTSNEFDRDIRFCGDTFSRCDSRSTSFDSFGNQYIPTKVTITNSESSSFLVKTLVADVPTEATILFDNISTRAVDFSLLDLTFKVDSVYHTVKFRNIAF